MNYGPSMLKTQMILFLLFLIQNKGVFDLKSFKNTTWKGLSDSSKENMHLLINQIGIESNINLKN